MIRLECCILRREHDGTLYWMEWMRWMQVKS